MITKIGRKNNFYYWGDMKGFTLRVRKAKTFRIEDVLISLPEMARGVISLLEEREWQLKGHNVKAEPIVKPFWGLRIWIGNNDICLRRGEIKKLIKELKHYFLIWGV